jgi:5-methylthioadenosine/S-adenosylhomocysteine deaminase
MSAQQVLKMATLDGARALCWENEIGSIEVGKKADLAIINFEKPHLCPLYNEVSHLVYATKSADVETVIINGKVVMENRRLATLNVERVMKMVKRAKNRLLERLQAQR